MINSIAGGCYSKFPLSQAIIDIVAIFRRTSHPDSILSGKPEPRGIDGSAPWLSVPFPLAALSLIRSGPGEGCRKATGRGLPNVYRSLSPGEFFRLNSVDLRQPIIPHRILAVIIDC